MGERALSGSKLEWWALQASPAALVHLVGGELAHARYRTRFVIEDVVNGTVVARSPGGDPERRASLEHLAREGWRLLLRHPEHAALIKAIEHALPPPPPPTVEDVVAEALAQYGVPVDAFRTLEDAVWAINGRRQWDAGAPVSDDEQLRFFRAVQPGARRLFSLAEPCLTGWLEDAERHGGGRLDHVRRLRYSTFCRWAEQQELAEPVSAFVEDADFTLDDRRLELQLLSHRAALLLDLDDLMQQGVPILATHPGRLVAISLALLARAEPLQRVFGGPLDPLSGHTGDWWTDPFEALQRRAWNAARRAGVPVGIGSV